TALGRARHASRRVRRSLRWQRRPALDLPPRSLCGLRAERSVVSRLSQATSCRRVQSLLVRSRPSAKVLRRMGSSGSTLRGSPGGRWLRSDERAVLGNHRGDAFREPGAPFILRAAGPRPSATCPGLASLHLTLLEPQSRCAHPSAALLLFPRGLCAPLV